MQISAQLADKITTIVGPGYLLLDADSAQHYGRDCTRTIDARPCAVALPGSVEEVQALVLLANEEQLAIVPSGGRTGLSGGAVAVGGELVVALDRLAIDGDAAQAHALADRLHAPAVELLLEVGHQGARFVGRFDDADSAAPIC